jgi:hypothetical protein
MVTTLSETACFETGTVPVAQDETPLYCRLTGHVCGSACKHGKIESVNYSLIVFARSGHIRVARGCEVRVRDCVCSLQSDRSSDADVYTVQAQSVVTH